MTICSKCKTKVKNMLWIVDGTIFCSPFCERSDWDNKNKKWTTKFHKHGDKQVDNFGIAGLAGKKKN